MVSPRSLLIFVVLPAALLLASCKSSDKKTTLPKNLPKINVSSSESSPPHRMSRGEYPFDSRGNYVTSWAAEGPRGGSSSESDHDSWSDSHDNRSAAPAPVVASSSRSTRTSAPTMVLSSTSSSSRSAVSAPTSTRVSQPSSSSSRSSTTSSRSSSSSSTPKKTAPTKKTSSSSSSTYHTVKSGDTLYGLALRYKSSVAKIKSANGLKSDLIRPGQKLRVPR